MRWRQNIREPFSNRIVGDHADNEATCESMKSSILGKQQEGEGPEKDKEALSRGAGKGKRPGGMVSQKPREQTGHDSSMRRLQT